MTRSCRKQARCASVDFHAYLLKQNSMNKSTHSKSSVPITKAYYLPLDQASQWNGIRAIEPNSSASHAVRGNLYIVVELVAGAEPAENQSSSDSRNQARELGRVAERLLGLIQTTYYTAKGSQAAVTERAIGEVHAMLRQHNLEQPLLPLKAGVTCAALLRDRLIITCSGPGLTLIATDEALEQFPWHQYGTAEMLGNDQMPEIHSYKRTIHGCASLFIGSTKWLEYFTVRKLLGTVAQCTLDDSEEIARYLTDELPVQQLPGLLVVAEIPSESAFHSSQTTGRSVAFHSGADVDSSDVPSEDGYSHPFSTADETVSFRPSIKRESSLPSSVNATPPVVSASGFSGQPHQTEPLKTDQLQEDALWAEDPTLHEEKVEEVPAAHSPRVSNPLTERSVTGKQSAAPSPPGSESTQTASTPSSMQKIGETTGSHFKQMFDRLKHFVSDLLPDRESTLQRENRAVASAQVPVGAPGTSYRPVQQTVPMADTVPQPSVGAKKKIFTPPQPATGGRARLIISLAILLSFLVALVVYATVWWQGAERAKQVEELIAAAEGHLNNAQISLNEGNKGSARVSLQTAQQYLVEAEQIGGSRNTIDSLLAEISRELSGILQVTPLYGLVEPLVVFPFDASPHRLMVIDQDIYVLDKGKHQILRYRLDETRSSIPDESENAVLQQGQNVDGITVGPLIDIAWQDPIPGIEDKANLLVLDSNNQVFRYNQQVDGASVLTFGEQDMWQSPIQIQTYLGRFYIADGGRGQIYRYDPGLYTEAPEPWLIAANPSAVSSLSAMGIDGDIWLLFQEGLLLRYNQGEQLAFDRDDDVGLILEPVDLYVGTQENSYIYLADAGEERVLVFSKAGDYVHQLQAPEDRTLQDLRGIFVDEFSKTLYLLTKTSLFQHPLPE